MSPETETCMISKGTSNPDSRHPSAFVKKLNNPPRISGRDYGLEAIWGFKKQRNG